MIIKCDDTLKENISEVAVSVEPIVIETPTPMVGNTEKNNTSASGSATSKLHKHNKLHSRSSSPLKVGRESDQILWKNIKTRSKRGIWSLLT